MDIFGNSIGLLGISGKYGELDLKVIDKVIEATLDRYDALDTASVYGEGFSINKRLATRLNNESSIRIINKIGANLQDDISVNSLINEFEIEHEIFKGKLPAALLLHRP
ncbi:hypothetical protein [Psychrosphaera algicola]|uniref:NADP-dependent oxidoreductase domain-containing protein n=1 Tax=Psychrosphaera algicola TaxID=3023714 RepID=A0ABT5FJI5_9GAMM|nr:hypothetical protein [Psychrosphaera sp. G1-22]MDC2891352.1 hypothetical protein [Psychrosphaera sp. G1-22]